MEIRERSRVCCDGSTFAYVELLSRAVHAPVGRARTHFITLTHFENDIH